MLGTSLLRRSTVAFTYLEVKFAKCFVYFRSWSWSWKQRSWSCYCGLGLKNLVLFTPLFIIRRETAGSLRQICTRLMRMTVWATEFTYGQRVHWPADWSCCYILEEIRSATNVGGGMEIRIDSRHVTRLFIWNFSFKLESAFTAHGDLNVVALRTKLASTAHIRSVELLVFATCVITLSLSSTLSYDLDHDLFKITSRNW